MRFYDSGDRFKLYMYGDIGRDYLDGLTADDFAKALDAAGGKPVDIHVNSGGGDVFEAHAMLTAIRAYEGEVVTYIDGIAASAASYFGLASDRVEIAPHALMMIHKASMLTYGNSDELRESAALLETIDDTLVSIYSEKTGIGRDELMGMLAAETWLTADEAVERGFADSISEGAQRVAAKVDERISARWRKAPANALDGERSEQDAPQGDIPAADIEREDETEEQGGQADAAAEAHERITILSSGITLNL